MICHMSHILLFDIDNTLLDTQKLMNHFIKPALQENLVSQWDQFAAVSDRYWQTIQKPTLFDPEQYLTHLAVSFEAQRPALSNLFYTQDFYESSLFPDVKDMLAALASNFKLGIYSEGTPTFQVQKLELAGIKDFFKPELIFVSSDKIEPQFLATLPDATIIDDRLLVIETLAKEVRFQPVWLNRDSLSQKTNTFCDTIYTLSELPALQ